MENPDVLNDVRFLHDVVARTERPRLNYYWPVTVSWGVVVTITYLICGFHLFPMVWCSLYFIGYMMNGVLLSNEWFWAAGVMLASMIAAYLAGPDFYWLPGAWIGGTFLLAGLLGRRNVLRRMAQA